MRIRIAVACLLLLAIATSVGADCQYFRCYVSETTGTCSHFYCNGLGCLGPDVIYANGCYVTCNWGGCWCTGTAMCYDI